MSITVKAHRRGKSVVKAHGRDTRLKPVKTARQKRAKTKNTKPKIAVINNMISSFGSLMRLNNDIERGIKLKKKY